MDTTGMVVGKQEKAKSKVSKRILLAWPSRSISIAVGSILLGYATYYATDFMGLSAATVGLVFMIAKIFDGFTDLVAGFLIDKTRTKWGKARPYEFALIGYWVSLVLLFSAPKMGVSLSVIYLFTIYSMVNSIWGTLLSVNENVYLANALEDRSKSVTVIALTGFIGLIFTIAASIALPQMITSMGTERSGWTLIAIILAIPFTLFGLLRFLLVKEVKDSGENAAAHITLKEAFFLLIKNKYIMLYCALLLLANLGQNLSVATYYYTVVMGDLSLASVMSMSMLVTVVVIIIAPIVSKKFGLTNLIKVCTLIGAVGFLLKLLDLSNVGLLFASTLLSSLGFVPMYAFAGTFVIDCMDYGEWKYKKRSEGVLNCTTGVASKIGTAFGAGLMGILMGIAGYNGMAEVQTQSASHMIIALNTVIPAVFCIILFVLLRFYDLDKKIVKIREDLKR